MSEIGPDLARQRAEELRRRGKLVEEMAPGRERDEAIAEHKTLQATLANTALKAS